MLFTMGFFKIKNTNIHKSINNIGIYNSKPLNHVILYISV